MNISGATLRNASAVAALLLLSACAASNVGTDYAVDETKGTGVLVASLTRSGQSGFNMFVDLRSLDGKYTNAVPVTDLFFPSDWGCPLFGEIPKEQPCGRLAIIELPQGEYEFYSWHGGSGGGPGTIRIDVRSVHEFSKRFKITAGKALYVGNINFALDTGFTKGLLGLPVPKYTYKMEITDKRDRDLTLLYQKNPKIVPSMVIVDTLQ